MPPPVITITRQYAAGGSDVARLVAAALDWTVIDNEFVDEVARRAGLAPDVIAEAAAHGRAVLVGRGAQALLAQRPDALHVYVVASKPWRMQLAVRRLGADPATAERVVDDTDRQRDLYVKTYYGRQRQDLGNYDLVVNTERLSTEGAAQLIVAEARRRKWS